jgi:hypothetical protein
LNRRPGFVTLVLALVLLCAAGARATPVLINPGAGLAGNAAALAAFNRAAVTWGGYLNDPITVNINADLFNMGSPSILGSTSATFLAAPYATIRNAMVADAAADPDDGIVASLPTAAQFSAFVPSGFGLNGDIAATKANLKALGFTGLDAGFGWQDAEMSFNSGFTFDYDNSDGVTAGSYDFETIALHEIGHVLGFVSAVDDIDYYRAIGQPISSYLYPLDLFRFPTSGLPTTVAQFTSNPRSLAPGQAASFSDLANIWGFSTGYYTGDGRQASHWKADELTGTYIGIMDPTLASGTIELSTSADLRALDVIGWDIVPTTRVPDAGSSLLLLGMGLAVLRSWKKRIE